MRESNVIVEFVKNPNLETRGILEKVVALNFIDILTTAIYFHMNPKASDFSPFYHLLGLGNFLIIKFFVVPFLYLIVTEKMTRDGKYITFILFFIVYLGAILINLWNICIFR